MAACCKVSWQLLGFGEKPLEGSSERQARGREGDLAVGRTLAKFKVLTIFIKGLGIPIVELDSLLYTVVLWSQYTEIDLGRQNQGGNVL